MRTKTERLTIMLTKEEKEQLMKETKENNTTLTLLIRKKIFGGK
jgi:hypothetical protein